MGTFLVQRHGASVDEAAVAVPTTRAAATPDRAARP